MHGILKVEPIIISPKTTKKKSSEIIPGMFKISGLVKADIKFIVEYIDKKIPQKKLVFLTNFKAFNPQIVCYSISSLFVLAV